MRQARKPENAGKTIGVVTGIQGLRWFNVEVTGKTDHAGTTPLALRKDAVRDSIAKRRAQIESSLADSQARAERAGVPVVQIALTPTETLEIPVVQVQKVEVQK